MKKTILTFVALLLVCTITKAQETTADVESLTSTTQEEEKEELTSPFSITGSVDAYFRSNISSQRDQAPVTSFANKNGFALGMANLVAGYEKGKVSATADLVFGPRGKDAVFASVGSSSIVNQLFVDWSVSEKTTLTIGNFNTFLGYEVISPVDNFNYSTSYMFSYGPFSHTGLKADFDLGSDFTGMLGVFNPTDLTEFNPVNTYTLGAQLGYKDFFFNVLYGDQDGKIEEDIATAGTFSAGNTLQVDLTGGKDVGENLYLGVNATYNTTDAGEWFNGTSSEVINGDAFGFYGMAGYAQVNASDSFALGTRIEYFGEYNGAGILNTDNQGDGNILDLTLTGDIAIDGLHLKPELRLDLASEDSFVNRNLQAQQNLASFVIGAVYGF